MQKLIESIENMNAKSLSYWLCMFVQEFANKSVELYPSRTFFEEINFCCLQEMFFTSNSFIDVT